MPRTKRKRGQVPVRKRLVKKKTHKAKPSLFATRPATEGVLKSSPKLEILNDEPSTSIQDPQSYRPESIGLSTPDVGAEVVDQSPITSLPSDAALLDCEAVLDNVSLEGREDPAGPEAHECWEASPCNAKKMNQVTKAVSFLSFHNYAQSLLTRRRDNSSQPAVTSEASSSHLTSSHLCISSSDSKVCGDISVVRCESQVIRSSRMKALSETELLLRVKTELEKQLPALWWIPVVDHNGIHVLLFSRFQKIAVQRDIYFTLNGNITLNVHCEEVDIEPYMKDAPAFIQLSELSFDCFLERVSVVVKNVRQMEICSGADYAEYKSAWPGFRYGQVDNNPYQEARYTETMRSLSCKRLVSGNRWRCAECTKLREFLKRRYLSSLIEVAHPFTSHNHMTEEQKDSKLEAQRKKLDANRKLIDRRKETMKKLLEEEGVDVDQELSKDLSEILKNHEISEPMRLLLEQQVKASQKKNLCGMRWHPTMIRWALSLYQKSPAACESARNSPLVILPSNRTLFDYSHADDGVEGIDPVVIKSVSERVEKLERDFQKYFVLIGDEVYISKNLVHRKSSGEIIGYTKLDEVDKQVKLLDLFLEGEPTRTVHEELTVTMMSFMIKGAANGIKEVVAIFPTKNMSADQMDIWFWELLGALERMGIAVLVFVCDGSTRNRMFIKKHTPFTKTKSGVIFDTINRANPSRILYFISDTADLIITIRNCFKNSRLGTGKGTRCIEKNGQFIVWDTIIKLYHAKKGKTLRKSYKLNDQHVYPDSYSCMKAKLACQVMSRTVAADIQNQKTWSHTEETVTFIENVNDWFDCVNGKNTLEGKRKINKYLLPYESPTDPRFDFLQSILDYFDDWTTEAPDEADDTRRMDPSNVYVASELDRVNLPQDSVEEELNATATDSNQARKRLSHHTLYGIEMTTRSFIAVTRFLLQNGARFVNARVFSQDPLEHYFSKVGAGGGGSSNPNCERYYHKTRTNFVAGQLGCNWYRGNTREGTEETVLSEQPLKKKRSASRGGPVQKNRKTL